MQLDFKFWMDKENFDSETIDSFSIPEDRSGSVEVYKKIEDAVWSRHRVLSHQKRKQEAIPEK